MLMHQSRSASVRVVGTALVIAAASLFASVASATGDERRSAQWSSTAISIRRRSVRRAASVCAAEVRVEAASVQQLRLARAAV